MYDTSKNNRQNKTKMKIIILGSKGFIGSNLVNFLLKDNNFEVFGCDLLDSFDALYDYRKLSIHSTDFDNLFKTHTFDFCINAAGSGNVGYSYLHPSEDFEVNTFSVLKIIETIKKNQPLCKYLHISSAAVYGNPDFLPIDESFKIKPLSPYGYHKWMSEIICEEYFHLYNLPISIIRPFSVYGNGLKKQLLWDLCLKLKENPCVTLFGTGAETRDFIHIFDLVDAIMTIIRYGRFQFEIYNVASSKEISIAEVACFFENNFPGAEKISFNGEAKQGDPVNWRADISKLEDLGFEPKVPFEIGAIQYINWFLEQ